MTERYVAGIWWNDPSRRAFVYWRPGFYDDSLARGAPDIVLPHQDIDGLILVLNEGGWITPTIDRESRVPDLHIIDELIKLAHTNAKRKP